VVDRTLISQTITRQDNRPPRLGLEPLELEGGGGTVDELMEWWIEKFLKKAGSDTGGSRTQSR
jgi:hypothetical protein